MTAAPRSASLAGAPTLKVGQLRAIKKGLVEPIERLHALNYYSHWQSFAPLEKLASYRKQVEAGETLDAYDQGRMDDLLAREDELLTAAVEARLNLRETRAELAELLEPVWQHIAASPHSKWARYGEVRPKVLRSTNAPALIELAVFASDKERAAISCEVLKWMVNSGSEHPDLTGLSARGLSSMEKYYRANGINPVLQLSRLGFRDARAQVSEALRTQRVRERLQGSGALIGKVGQHEIRVIPPADLPTLGVWLRNCIGRDQYVARGRFGRGAVLAACPTRGEFQGVPVAVVEVHPSWKGLATGEWASPYRRGWDARVESQRVLREFLQRKSAASRVQHAASLYMA